MKGTKRALVRSSSSRTLGTVTIDIEERHEAGQVMSDVANLVQASLVQPTTESGETLTVSQSEAHSVTSMLWSSEGILRQALLSPGIVNFTNCQDEEKQTKDASSHDLENVKNTNTPLPPMSELQRHSTSTISLESESDAQLMRHESNQTSTVTATETLDPSLIVLQNAESFKGTLPQFPSVSYKLVASSELMASNANMEPLPPISEVHKAAAGQLLETSVSSKDQLLSSESRSKDLTTYQSSSPLPSDTVGSLLLSSARGPLPTMSSSQVSSLLSALGSELSNSEMPVKELSSLSEIELSTPRKLAEQLGIDTSKVPILELHLNTTPQKISTVTQTNQLEDMENLIALASTATNDDDSATPKINSLEAETKTINLSMLKILTPFNKTTEVSNSDSITFSVPILNADNQPVKVVTVKQEQPPKQILKNNKSSVPKKTRTRKKNSADPVNEKKSLVERVVCFKCSFCPFLSLDKDGVDLHIAEEHKPPDEETTQHVEPQSSELQCPGCPNVFFSMQALQVHLCQDHRVTESEVQQIVAFLCPEQASPAENVPESAESAKTDQRVCKKNKSLSSPNVEVYTDEQGKIHVRPGAPPAPTQPEIYTDEQGKLQVQPGPSQVTQLSSSEFDPDEPGNSGGSEGDICDTAENEAEMSCDNVKEDGKLEIPFTKKRGRPRGSRNIGITALRRQNPSLRLGEKELGYCCAIDGCAVRLRSHDNIEYHRRCHSTGSTFLCPECRNGFTQWRALTAHLWRAHVIDMELYACDQCSFKTNSYSKLINLHKRIHGSERPFLCDTCGKGFKTNKQLRNHKVIHNTSAKSRRLKSGKCDICLRHFADKRLLRVHKDTVHEKLRPFLCNYCGYSASSRSTLKMHMRQHTGEKPFACTECEYKTADHNSLRRHRMRHTGQKKYQCPYCSYACIQSSTYKTHLRNKHPGQDDGLLFSCPHCPFRTVKKDNHIAHLAEHKTGALAIMPQKQTPTAPITKIPAKRPKRNIPNKPSPTAGKQKVGTNITPASKIAASLACGTRSRPKLAPAVNTSSTVPPSTKKKVQLKGKKKAKCKSATEGNRCPVPNTQLKLAAQLEELGIEVPVLTVIDSNKLMQLSASDLVPLGLTAAQATALQLALANAEHEHTGTESNNSVATGKKH